MRIDITIYAVILAIINCPFVIEMDWYLRKRLCGRVFAVFKPLNQRAREIRNSYLTILVHAILFIAFIGSRALRTQRESFSVAIASLGLAFRWTETWHYIPHVAMHTKPLHFIHMERHPSRLTARWTTGTYASPGLRRTVPDLRPRCFTTYARGWRRVSFRGTRCPMSRQNMRDDIARLAKGDLPLRYESARHRC